MMTLSKLRCDERGSVLIISLFFLIALTMIGLAGMQTTTLEEKMTANMGNRQRALAAAEAALREGEQYLADYIGVPPTDGTVTFVHARDTDKWEAASTWTTTASAQYDPDNTTTDDQIGIVTAQPRYYIEELASIEVNDDDLGYESETGEMRMYRITARGVGGNTRTEVIVQSTYLDGE